MNNKSTLLGIGTLIIVIAVIIGLFLSSHTIRYMVFSTPVLDKGAATIIGSDPSTERFDLAYRYFISLDNRVKNLQRAEKLLVLNEEEQSQYLLARIYFAMNDTERVLEQADRYLEKYPNNKRMHYVRGLANAYQKNFEQAEADFKEFIAYDPQEWAGYLDLSWVYFQTGKMNEARQTIEQGYEVAPDNPWISTAYGVILFNQLEQERAVFLLEEAQKQAEQLSVEQWRSAYSASDPSQASHDLEQFKKLITFNLDLVTNTDDITLIQVREALEMPFADVSLRGMEYGLHPSACNGTCPACNVCGSCRSHTHPYSCSAPALPSGYGSQCFSARNKCAQNNRGVIGCNGCTAVVPELPVPSPTGFYLVPDDGEVLIYEAGKHSSTLAQKCYRLNNQSGSNMFVPVKTVGEFNNFIQSSWVGSNASVDLVQLAP